MTAFLNTPVTFGDLFLALFMAWIGYGLIGPAAIRAFRKSRPL